MNAYKMLKKIMDKAIANGFKPPDGFIKDSKRYGQVYTSGKNKYWTIVFRHDFAKAFFGEEKIEYIKPDSVYLFCKHDGCTDDTLTENEFITEYGQESLDELMVEDEWEEVDGVYRCCNYWKLKYINKGWQYYLKEMVLEANPLKYLLTFI